MTRTIDVERSLTNRRHRVAASRCDGTVVGSAQFTGSGGVDAEIGDQVREDDVRRLFAEGSTVVLQGLHRTWPAVIDFATRLDEELGHSVQASAYVTPPSSRASPRTTTCTACSCCSSQAASTGRCTHR